MNVFYMPKKPGESVLEIGIHSRIYFIPAFGAGFFLMGLEMFVFVPNLLKKHAEQADAGNRHSADD